MSIFQKPERCIGWIEDAAQNLAEASFLTIAPNGEVLDSSGNGLTAGVNTWNVEFWSIATHFSLRPCWDVADFRAEDRDFALQALLDWKGARPIFYRDMENTFQFHGTSVSELLAEMLAAGAFEDGSGVLEIPRLPGGSTAFSREDAEKFDGHPVTVL